MTYLIAIGGHTGTGKTTLAYALRQVAAPLAGALVVEDDQMRRELLVRSIREKLRPEDYGPEVSAKVREKLDERIKAALASGQCVIDSSGFYRHEARRGIEELAHACGATFVGIWLVASRAAMEERIRKRTEEREEGGSLAPEKGHASDACAGVLDKFGDIGQPSSWTTIDADGAPEEVLERVREKVAL